MKEQIHTIPISDAMENAGEKINYLKTDGGVSNNNFLMQFQSDISNIDVIKTNIEESTALGVYYLAGLKVGMFSDLSEIKEIIKIKKTFSPKMCQEKRKEYLSKWHKAVRMCQGWEED